MEADRKQFVQGVVDAYVAWGFSFTPIVPPTPDGREKGKRPAEGTAWESRPRESLDQAMAWAKSGNVGVRCGAWSADPAGRELLVIDLDVGFDLAAVNAMGLPHTLTVRTGSGGWHLYYRLPKGVSLGQTCGKLAPKIDTRGHKGQVLFVGCIHPRTGQPYTWARGPKEFPDGPVELPADVIARLQKPKAPKPSPQEPSSCPLPAGEGKPPPAAGTAPPVASRPAEPASKYALAAFAAECDTLRRSADHEHTNTLNTVAFNLGTLIGARQLDRAMVEGALLAIATTAGWDDSAAWRSKAAGVLKSGLDAGIAKPRVLPSPAGRGQGEGSSSRPVHPREPSPNPLPAGEGQTTPPDDRPPAAGDGMVALGEEDPHTGRLVLSKSKTLPTAMAYCRAYHLLDDPHAGDLQEPPPRKLQTLYSYGGRLLAWVDGRYADVEDGAVKCRLLHWLHQALQYRYNPNKQEFELKPFDSNPRTVSDALHSLHAHCHLSTDRTAPFWLAGDTTPPGTLVDVVPTDVLACKSVQVHLPTGDIWPATPRLFTRNALAFDFDESAPEPAEWLAFMDQLWPNDPESVGLLQEWFGYCLTPDTCQQKMFLLTGPPRCGKGTIGRILTRLVGAANVANPKLEMLGSQFGLMSLIGKTVSMTTDAKWTTQNLSSAMETMLCISGEDDVTFDVKLLAPITVRLPVRLMFLSTELPKFRESSGAIAHRFLMLRLTESFLGREDLGLERRLTAELPGILRWAVAGWRRLHDRGRFAVPESARTAMNLLVQLTSLIGEFVGDRCEIRPDAEIRCDHLYDAYCEWLKASTKDGSPRMPSSGNFARELYSAAPQVSSHQSVSKWGGSGRFYRGIALRSPEPTEAGEIFGTDAPQETAPPSGRLPL